MPTTQIKARAFRQDVGLLTVAVQDADQIDPQFKAFDMTVERQMTLEEMGQAALDQPVEPIPDPVFNGEFSIVWHIEEIVGPHGAVWRRRVLDSIVKI